MQCFDFFSSNYQWVSSNLRHSIKSNFKSKALPVEVEASDRNIWSIVIRLCFREWYRAQNLIVVPHGPSNHVCSQVTNLSTHFTKVDKTLI